MKNTSTTPLNGSFVPRGLYPIVDSRHLDLHSLSGLCESILAAGCPWLQIRAKDWDKARLRRETLRIAYLKVHNPFLLILNGHPELAAEIGADGVHVSQTPQAIGEARNILGPGAKIGYSAHCRQEAIEAEAAGADYVSLGAIFETPGKADDHPLHGPSGLWEVISALSIPVIAVGGIDLNSLPQLIQRQASPKAPKRLHGFSVIRALSEAHDPTDAAKQLQFVWDSILVAHEPVSH